MAKAIGKANFVVIPTQFDTENDEAVQGYAFPDAGAAQNFAQTVQAFAKKAYAKYAGISVGKDATDEQKKAAKAKLTAVGQGAPFDVLIQRLDNDNEPDGDPMLLTSLRK